MAYWRTANGIIGDGPADAMGDAIDEIRESYRAELRREPSKAEIRDVLEFVLAPLDALAAGSEGSE
jgi:hypothetical protein